MNATEQNSTHTPGIAKAGEIWRTRSRKGPLVVRFMSDVDTTKDGFVDAEIITGTARYMSESNRFLQQEYGQGTPGETITMRTTLLTLIERIEIEGCAL